MVRRVGYPVDGAVRSPDAPVPLVLAGRHGPSSEPGHLPRHRVNLEDLVGVGRDTVDVPVEPCRGAVPHPLPFLHVAVGRTEVADGCHLAGGGGDLEHGGGPRGNAEDGARLGADTAEELVLAVAERVVVAQLRHLPGPRHDAHHPSVVGGHAVDVAVVRHRRAQPLVLARDGGTVRVHDGLAGGVARLGIEGGVGAVRGGRGDHRLAQLRGRGRSRGGGGSSIAGLVEVLASRHRADAGTAGGGGVGGGSRECHDWHATRATRSMSVEYTRAVQLAVLITENLRLHFFSLGSQIIRITRPSHIGTRLISHAAAQVARIAPVSSTSSHTERGRACHQTGFLGGILPSPAERLPSK